MLLQMEIPMPALVQAVELGHASGARVILNPAPAQFVPDSVLSRLYMITPNRAEGRKADRHQGDRYGECRPCGAHAGRQGDRARGHYAGAERGLHPRCGGGVLHSGRERVEAVDTTAAGDTFNGALCVALSEGRTLFDAVRFASRAAAIAVAPVWGADLHPVPERVESRIRIKP